MSCPCCGRSTKSGGLGPVCAAGACSCRSRSYKTGSFGRSSLRNVAQSAGTAAVVGTASVYFPPAPLFYEVIKNAYFLDKTTIYIERGNYPNAMEAVVGKIVGDTIGKLTEKEAEDASDLVLKSATETGAISQVCRNSQMNENVYAMMFKASVRMGLGEGASSLVEFAIDKYGVAA